MASLLAKNWYNDPTDVSARAAIMMVVALSKPTSANTSEAALRMASTRCWPRFCFGLARNDSLSMTTQLLFLDQVNGITFAGPPDALHRSVYPGAFVAHLHDGFEDTRIALAAVGVDIGHGAAHILTG